MWYRRAAEGGNAEAQVMLGWMHAAGRGVPSDPAESRRWFCLAAVQGNPVAREHLEYLDPGSAERCRR
jgi:TPR repeat protein